MSTDHTHDQAPGDLDPATIDRLLAVFLQGYAGGFASGLAQTTGAPADLARAAGQQVARAMYADPIVRTAAVEQITAVFTGTPAPKTAPLPLRLHHPACSCGTDHHTPGDPQ